MIEQKFYLTEQGLKKIEQEYKNLLALKQEKLQTGAPVAFHSEELDIEFVSFKEDLEFLESRIAELDYILKNYELIKPPAKSQQQTISVGAAVLVEVNGQKEEFRIVGTLEADPNLCRISNESPVGKTLLGKKEGDIAVVNSETKTVYKILKVSY